MAEDAKKISFSFKQISSKPKTIVVPPARKTTENAVQFIDCVEEKSIRVIGGSVEKVEQELVIPAQPSSVGRRLLVVRENPKRNGATENGNDTNDAARTLDEIAVDAILSDCKRTATGENGSGGGENDGNAIEVPMMVNPPEGSEEPSAEDYDDVPVERFGLAMIRGMGWVPPPTPAKRAADKNPDRAANDDLPNRRPNGMGLGADKLIRSSAAAATDKRNRDEELTLGTGSYVQFVLGRLDGQYGQVEGFDDGDGRVTVKIARTGQVEKVNENVFRLVTKSDYGKNSKVINIKKYKDYKEGVAGSEEDSSGSEDDKRRGKKKSSSRRDDDGRRGGDHRSSSSSSRHHKTKKSKHSKSPHRKHKSDRTRHKKYKRKRSSS